MVPVLSIFFDVDGVLVDGFHAKPERRNRWDKRLYEDLGIDVDDFQSFFKGRFASDVMVGALPLEEDLKAWLSEHQYKLPAREVMAYWFEKDSVLNTQVYECVKTLASCAEVSLYIATNQPHERARYLWDQVGFKTHFKEIFYSAQLGCCKDDPNFFVQVERVLSLNPSQTSPLFFDDYEPNIKTARDRGWEAVLVDGPEDVTQHPLIQPLLLKTKISPKPL